MTANTTTTDDAQLETDGGRDVPPGEADFQHGQPEPVELAPGDIERADSEPKPHFARTSEYQFNEQIYQLIKSAVITTAEKHPYDAARHTDEHHRRIVRHAAEAELFGRLHEADVQGYGYEVLQAWLENMVMVVTDPWEQTIDEPARKQWANTRASPPAIVGLERRGPAEWVAYLDGAGDGITCESGEDRFSMRFTADELMANNR